MTAGTSANGAPGKSAPDGLPVPRRYYAAATVVVGMSLSVLDATIANVALPTIAADLNAPPSAAVWVLNAYNLAVVTMLLPMSAVAERIGFRRMFTIGLTLFTLASLACAVSSTLLQLSLARMVQGIGAATLMCMFGGLVRNIYPTSLLGRGISINATTVALMSVLGPTIGSFILSVADWRWIFAVNLSIGIVLMMGLRFLPEVQRNTARMDYVSAVLSMVTLGCFISGVDSLAQDVLRSLGLIAVSVVSGLLLIRRSWGQTSPLVPIDLLRIRTVGFAVMASASTFAAQMSSYVALPFYFQHVLGRPHLEVGLLMAAWPLGTGLIAPVAGFLSDRYSAAVLSCAGAGAMVVGLLWLVCSPLDASNPRLMVGMFIAGVGFGFFQTPNNRAMLAGAPRHRSGAAGGLQATTRVFGQSFGTALVAIAFGLSAAHGPTLGLIAAAVCASLAIGVNSVRIAKRIGQPER
ncbi:MFS transporter [Bordetella holmesii]|uniref:Transporter, major facilitator family protein n=1 Tax=Bordetella holmesii CDC-H585-BH TaxID=1331206 RepID=A0A158MA58_9BORD|nr:MFS transporter [Bordetella holmesii]AIT26283.1 sugar (and other) transporter family protein [Bordetella holmesii 44057]EWM42419.1 sugar (and other) transporter family protein [Bordetella holmesii 41130]EWM51027.1 sugar (and other) transporter family protein [Bordetella holmesii 70147]AMD49239.1 MFS transporter [Bordetella holmesii F627]AOB34218.1 MFS transporter [Bordetella holmesii]